MANGYEPWKLPAERPTATFQPRRLNRTNSVAPAEGRRRKDESSDPEWENLVEVLHLNRRRLLRLPGVLAVDIGYKIKNGIFSDTPALRIHVERKLPDRYFKDHPRELVSKSKDYKGKEPVQDCLDANGKPVTVARDVIEAEYHLTSNSRRSAVLERPLNRTRINRRLRIDPLVGGISIGSPQAPVGTLGALVWDKTDGSVCILSNWHVLAGNLNAEIGNPCLQPAPFDRGREEADVVARLKRWSFDSQTDAALAELTGNRHYCAGEILGLTQPISDVVSPHLGMRVRKSGRSTETTPGFVDGLYFSSTIEYGSGAVQVFEDQIHIAPVDPDQRISESGDSGAVWVSDADGRAVGLHFAGDLPHSAFGEYALANPMTIVMDRLKFSFRPVFLEIRDDDVVLLEPAPRFGPGTGRRRDGSPDRFTRSGPETQGDQIPVRP
ncbi:MAG TPA: hypothetical protein VN493_25445 [Thermoanaerobaculia bacterium]|nr:hypothetical protein [Thermoanaerobaculia bacterium]